MAVTWPGTADTTATFPVDWRNDTDLGDGTEDGSDATVGYDAQWRRDVSQLLLNFETELGVDPAGPYAATVQNRFEILAYKGQSVRFATAQALPAVTYANGTAGVGATLTANANGVMAAVDGVTPVAGDRMLVKNQAAPLQNGIYVVTSIGAVGAPFVLTRHYDADTSAKIADAKVMVDLGTAGQDTEWLQSSTAPTMGTTALYWRRTTPIYGHGNPRSPWAPGSSWPTGAPVIMETVPRAVVAPAFTFSIGAAVQYLFGGIVVPAGRTVTNINYVARTAGAAPSVSWLALIRQDTRVVQCHTANIVTAPTVDVTTTRAFTAPWTPIEDTPVWVVFSYNHATTAMLLFSSPLATTVGQNLIAPAMAASNGVAPTTTVPTDGTTVITAPTTGQLAIPYIWLT